jgi:putative MATE family efflux protein
MDYIFYILVASPWMVAAIVLNQQLRFQGSAAIAMVGMISGNVLNVILLPIFIFTIGLGVKGASIATLICQVVSFFILLLYGTTRKGNIRINLRDISPSASRYYEMFRGGFPSLLRQGLLSVATIVINNYARPYGDAAIAGISIASRINMFANSIALGFGQGFQPVCGFNYGAKRYSRVKKAFWFCVRFCFIGLFITSLVLAIFAPQIIAFFRKDDLEVIRIGAFGLRLYCISLPFMGSAVMVNMMTQTLGRALEASIIATSRQGLFLIPFLLIFNPFLGLTGIQLAIPAADLASLLIAIPIMLRTLKAISLPDEPLQTL